MTQSTLTTLQLNRALLARQFLLKREKTTALKVIEGLVGIQAQLARPPFLGLWSRVAQFDSAQLAKLAHRKAVVRVTSMRGTLHLMSTRDFLKFRSPLQPVLDRGMRGVLRERPKTFDLEQIVAEASAFFAATPAPFEALRKHLSKLHPLGDVRAMAYAVRCTLPLVMVPTDHPWTWPGAAQFTPAQAWLGKKVPAAADPKQLVLRYLAAFGPATPADAQNWSGLQNLSDSFEALRPKLKTFADQRGRELFDLPDAPRPAAATPAPARFLPDWDTLVMGHADRTRVIDDAYRKKIATNNLQVTATFLVDGRVAGTWKLERRKTAAALVMTPFERLSRAARAELEEEGQALLRFAEPEALTFSVR